MTRIDSHGMGQTQNTSECPQQSAMVMLGQLIGLVLLVVGIASALLIAQADPHSWPTIDADRLVITLGLLLLGACGVFLLTICLKKSKARQHEIDVYLANSLETVRGLSVCKNCGPIAEGASLKISPTPVQVAISRCVSVALLGALGLYLYFYFTIDREGLVLPGLAVVIWLRAAWFLWSDASRPTVRCPSCGATNIAQGNTLHAKLKFQRWVQSGSPKPKNTKPVKRSHGTFANIALSCAVVVVIALLGLSPAILRYVARREADAAQKVAIESLVRNTLFNKSSIDQMAKNLATQPHDGTLPAGTINAQALVGRWKDAGDGSIEEFQSDHFYTTSIALDESTDIVGGILHWKASATLGGTWSLDDSALLLVLHSTENLHVTILSCDAPFYKKLDSAKQKAFTDKFAADMEASLPRKLDGKKVSVTVLSVNDVNFEYSASGKNHVESRVR